MVNLNNYRRLEKAERMNVYIWKVKLFRTKQNKFHLKLPGWDRSWMGNYATCSRCHLTHAVRTRK